MKLLISALFLCTFASFLHAQEKFSEKDLKREITEVKSALASCPFIQLIASKEEVKEFYSFQYYCGHGAVANYFTFDQAQGAQRRDMFTTIEYWMDDRSEFERRDVAHTSPDYFGILYLKKD